MIAVAVGNGRSKTFTDDEHVNVRLEENEDNGAPNKLDENMSIKSPGLKLSSQESLEEIVVSMWRCWNCQATENEMGAQCPRCLKLLAEFPGDDF